MATFKRFEDIQAWQKARRLAVEVYKLSGNGEFGQDYDLRKQVRRSSASIMSNIAEGQGRRTDRDFAHFLNIALGSVAETKSHLYLAMDLNYVSEETFASFYEKFDEIGKMVFGLISHLRPAETVKSNTSETSKTY